MPGDLMDGDLTLRRLALAAHLLLLARGVSSGGAAPAALTPAAGDVPQAATRAGSVTFAGQVVDLHTDKPVAGASLEVECSKPGVDSRAGRPWLRKHTARGDENGRFRLTFSPEQAAETRLLIAVRISHPDYVARTCWPFPLQRLIRAQRTGDHSFFEKITLAKGVEFRGQIVTPEGKPAAGLAYSFLYGAQENHRDNWFYTDTKGKTDAEGRFRLRMPRTRQLALYATPDDLAPLQIFWGVDDPSQLPDFWVPADLGQIVLSKGIPLPGRLLDRHGRPISRQSIVALKLNGQHKRVATTDESGRFTFAPLRQGNYVLHAQGQSPFGNVDPATALVGRSGAFFEPVKVHVREGFVPQPVVLRLGETVTVECRSVDSNDRPVRGNPVFFGGVLPEPKVKPVPFPAPVVRGLSEWINGPEEEDRTPLQLNFAMQLLPDDQGRTVFEAPKGLRSAWIQTNASDEAISVRSQAAAGRPLTVFTNVQLGDLKADVHGVRFIHYKAPVILVSLRNEEGEVPFVNVSVSANLSGEGTNYWAQFTEQDDGRFLSQSLVPDQEYRIIAWAAGLVPYKLHRVKLAEGASLELTIPLKRKPRAPEVGEMAPAFCVKTLDGRVLSLADLRGKVVMLNFWSPAVPNGFNDVPHLKKVHERFGKDKRFMLLGIGVAFEIKDAEKTIKEHEFSWPQVILRDSVVDSIVVDYDVGWGARTILIDPQGRIAAKQLAGTQIVDAVEKALGPK